MAVFNQLRANRFYGIAGNSKSDTLPGDQTLFDIARPADVTSMG